MNPVEKTLRQLIALDGPQSIERMMSLSNGYYYACHDPFGQKGDFITAPEISQMFGEMIGIWLISVWQAAQCPRSVQLVELGPGRGTLLHDALRTIHRLAPDLSQSVQVHLVETSPLLQNMQSQKLGGFTCPIAWHPHIEDVPEGFTFLIANEFFDALPVRHCIRGEKGWHEKRVILDNDTLAFARDPDIAPEILIPQSFHSATAGECAEFSPVTQQIVRTIAQRLAKQGGAALIVDYGHTQSQTGDTLQALKHHQPVPVLAHLGEADLTAHVDFAALALIAGEEGCGVQGAVTQAAFLNQLGIGLRAEQLHARATPEQQKALAAALERLTDTASPTAMGRLFKVLCIHHAAMPELAGFIES